MMCGCLVCVQVMIGHRLRAFLLYRQSWGIFRRLGESAGQEKQKQRLCTRPPDLMDLFLCGLLAEIQCVPSTLSGAATPSPAQTPPQPTSPRKTPTAKKVWVDGCSAAQSTGAGGWMDGHTRCDGAVCFFLSGQQHRG